LIFVFDSGVWISAFQFGGTPLIALRYAYMHYRLAACDSIFYEIHKTMARKFDEPRLSRIQMRWSWRATSITWARTLQETAGNPSGQDNRTIPG
jgi:hypothetical protein